MQTTPSSSWGAPITLAPKLQHDHGLIELRAAWLTLDRPLGQLNLDWTLAQAQLQATLGSDEATQEQRRQAIRTLLRTASSYKPHGQNKPSNEYLQRAFAQGYLSPERSINALVDLANIASLHANVPISVIDGGLLGDAPLSVDHCAQEQEFIFNPSGQQLRASGLLALFDALGPTATPVKDAQRTKTHETTTHALLLIWGSRELEGLAEQTAAAIKDALRAQEALAAISWEDASAG